MTPAAARRALLLVLVVIGGAACSSNGDGTTSPDRGSTSSSAAPTSTTVPVVTRSAGCENDEVAGPGVTDRTMTSGGRERKFLLEIPAGYDGTTPLPVVLALHSLTVQYTVVPAIGGFADMTDSYDFIAVSPSGLVNPVPYWLSAPTADNYDVTFLADLLDLLETELCVDPSHIYSTGMSNGGQMSSVLACSLSERVTAVAPIAGVEFSDICDGEPVPVMAFHGTEDPFVPYEGGGLDGRTISDQQYWRGEIPADVPEHDGVDAAMQRWAEHNGCDPEPTEERVSPEVRKRTWNGCDAATVLYVIDGGGHTWPGRPVPGFEEQFGHTTTDIDATALMFAFFFEEEA